MAHAHKHFGAEKVVTGETPHASSDMNVTPLIDVLLVLLIIFMAALPLSQKGVDVNLPLETNKPAQQTPSEQIVLEFNADRSIAVNKQPVTLATLAGQAARRVRDPPREDDVHRRRPDAPLRRDHRGDRRREGRRRRESRHRHRRHAARRSRPASLSAPGSGLQARKQEKGRPHYVRTAFRSCESERLPSPRARRPTAGRSPSSCCSSCARLRSLSASSMRTDAS